MLDVPNILLGITAAVNVGLTWFVYERSRDNPVNKLFALFVLFVALWALAILWFRITIDVAAALLLIKLSYVFALLLAFCFYRFAILFPPSSPPAATTGARLDILVGLLALALLVPGVLARGIVFHPWGKETTLEPLAWTLFAAMFLLFFLAGR